MSFLLPVRPARSILDIPEVLTKSHIVVFCIKSLHYSLVSSSHYRLPPPGPRLGLIDIDISSEGLVMDGHLVHLWEGFYLARVRPRMPLVKSPDS